MAPGITLGLIGDRIVICKPCGRVLHDLGFLNPYLYSDDHKAFMAHEIKTQKIYYKHRCIEPTEDDLTDLTDHMARMDHAMDHDRPTAEDIN